MKLPYLQLSQHLAKQLAPIYLISSDELLLAQEAISAIRAAAQQAGFTECVKLTPESGTDWGELLYTDTHSLSLFATKRIVEINLILTKLNSTEGKRLADYAAKPLQDTLLIIQTAKCDAKTEKARWYQAIEKTGVIIPIWPLAADQLPAWLIQRAKQSNLTLTKPAAERLARFVEGNLLAAAQEIEKLALLQTDDTLTEQFIEETVTDNTRFDVFHLVESALIGNPQRALHILKNLAAEGEEPTLILWALVRELRLLATLLQHQKNGSTLTSLFHQFRIWEKRQPGVRAFLQRHSLEKCWERLLHAAKIDRLIKGAEGGDVWHELEAFLMALAR